jgi:bla regulator protein BlaR1
MTDIWSFLLQSLTASGVALVLLLIKALFADKLSPRWQFAVWGVLVLALLLPAGLWGRYVLVNWPLGVETGKTLVESHLSSALSGPYTLTRVLAPIPLFPNGLPLPRSATDWLFYIYCLGILIFLLRHFTSYFKLRLDLRRGIPAGPQLHAQIQRVARQYGLAPCRAVEVGGIGSAFLCGVFRPILILPTGEPVDDKVILHELLHLKQRDVLWGFLLCLLQSLHWCNPLLGFCARRAQNDCEARCDQRVLERLEGEERRDYGRILLSMADDRYARMPGTSSMANGGRNIKARISCITRFKRYPTGMALVSACITLLLAATVLGGTQAAGVVGDGGHWDRLEFTSAMASARATRCTTAAGALDTYAKAVIRQNGIYRALCAPLSEHAGLAREMEAAATGPDPWTYTHWENGAPGYVSTSGYSLLNLTWQGEDACTALVVFPLQYALGKDGAPLPTEHNWLAAQTVQVKRTSEGWVVWELGEFQLVEQTIQGGLLTDSDHVLPPLAAYTGETDLFRVRVVYQTWAEVENQVESSGNMDWFFSSGTSFDSTPKPHAQFGSYRESTLLTAVFLGSRQDLDGVSSVAVSIPGQASELLDLERPWAVNSGGSSTSGEFYISSSVEEGWNGLLEIGGGGNSSSPMEAPPSYHAAIWINNQRVEELTLLPEKGGA